MKDLYDVRSLVKAFGGRYGLIDALQRGAGVTAKKKTVDKWVERNSLPGDAMLHCQVASEKLRLGINIMDYIVKAEAKPADKPKGKGKKK